MFLKGMVVRLEKKSLSETEIRTRYITPSLVNAGWSYDNIHEEKSFTDGRVIDKGHGEYFSWGKFRILFIS